VGFFYLKYLGIFPSIFGEIDIIPSVYNIN